MPHQDLPVADGTCDMRRFGACVLLQVDFWLDIPRGKNSALAAVGSTNIAPGSVRTSLASVVNLEALAVNDGMQVTSAAPTRRAKRGA